MLATLVIYPIFRSARRRLGVTSQSCVCIGTVCEPQGIHLDGSLAAASTMLSAQIGETSECVERYQGRMLGLEAGATLDSLHYLSAGTVGFARGLNDTPKIVALLIGAQAVSPNLGLFLVATVMAVGGILNARRVAETMSRKITRMSPGQGFTANLVTSILVALASRFALPVSTTHVSVGSLFAIGVVNGTANRKMILTILLAWVTTLPLGALMAASAYLVVQSLT